MIQKPLWCVEVSQRVLSWWAVVVRRVADKRGFTGRRAYLISQA